jgi:tungstate transport system ATP-binding protein
MPRDQNPPRYPPDQFVPAPDTEANLLGSIDAAPPILPLSLRNLCWAADGIPLIKNVSCTFEAGQRTVIIGPNGAGKSLLLRLCHGLIDPTAGDVVWHGANGRDASRFQAMVFQRPVMLRRSVEANVAFALKTRRIPRPERRDLVDEALFRTGLGHLAHQPARVLSFGEQQKLALARAWALRPQVLFLDEPTASLDPAATHAIEEIINAMHAAGTRIIMVTHDLGQARRLADEVMFMFRGRLREKASAEAFFAAPENDLAQAFLRGELLWWRRRSGECGVGPEEKVHSR